MFNRLINKYHKNHDEKLKENACYIYQVAEMNGKLWLTYNGFFVCPFEMFNDEPIKVLSKMRELFVNSHKTQRNE